MFVKTKDIKRIFDKLSKSGLTISTMESCTGGYLVSSLTNVEGSSKYVKGSIMSYCNDMKLKYGVDTIDKYGVYSVETAKSMARNVKKVFNSDIGIGVTGTFRNIDNENWGSIAGRVYYCIYIEKRARSLINPEDYTVVGEVNIPKTILLNRKLSKAFVTMKILKCLDKLPID